MQIMLVVEPIPGCDDNIALDTLRSRRLRMGQLAFGDAIRPVRKIAQIRTAELLDRGLEHRYAALSRLDAAKPQLLGILERRERMRHIAGKRAHGTVAYRMAV